MPPPSPPSIPPPSPPSPIAPSPWPPPVEQICVSTAARGKGIGRLLLQWAEAQARAANGTSMTLSVLNGNPARRLYERFGFEVVPADPYHAAHTLYYVVEDISYIC